MDASEITEQHVEAAKGIVERGRISEMISDLSPHGKYALRALTIADRRGDTPLRTRALYDIYRGVCNQQLTDPLSDQLYGTISLNSNSSAWYGSHRKTPDGPVENTNSTNST